MQISADSEAVGARKDAAAGSSNNNTIHVHPSPDPSSDHNGDSESIPDKKSKRQRSTTERDHEHQQLSAKAKRAARRKKAKRPFHGEDGVDAPVEETSAAPSTAINAKPTNQSKPPSTHDTAGARRRGRPKKGPEWEVDAILGARHARDSTADEPRFQYAVRWASSAGGETSWWTAESLQNDRLVVLELSKSIAAGTVWFEHTPQPVNEMEGALVEVNEDEETSTSLEDKQNAIAAFGADDGHENPERLRDRMRPKDP